MKISLIRVATRLAVALILNISVQVLLAHSVQGQQVGYVLDLSGDWFLNGHSRLNKGSSLSAGSTISTNSPSDRSNYIVISDRRGNIISRRDCSKKGECNTPINLPQAQSTSVATTIIDLVMSIWGSNDDKYVPLISKGADLHEAVLKFDTNQTDLSTVFKDFDAGDYYVKFEPLTQKKISVNNKPVGPLAFKWDAAKPVPLSANGLNYGLYRLILLKARGRELKATGADAWVLVSDASRYDEVSNSFGEAVRLTEQWGEQVSPDAARGFLRAYLDLLANGETQKNK